MGVVEAEVPRIEAPHEATVEVTTAGICGSDLHIYDGHGFSDEVGYTVGHEAVGSVREVGLDVTASVGCSSCRECSAGRVSSCLTKTGHWAESCYGLSSALPGSQAQYVRVHTRGESCSRCRKVSATRQLWS
ncbi:alcohol dehydrogenase catalytic domain-containing protein [Rhodococcus sp. NCIMB 12038]|uniref:alcohol dehydrogenase catalytic domain-containing protein n=1 Tax=Rhodococcus sp. NCIMB 12038 TaxID=933800 RepID=UPI00358DF944